MQSVFVELSEPVILEFNPGHPTDDGAIRELTFEQRSALQFRMIVADMQQRYQLAAFVLANELPRVEGRENIAVRLGSPINADADLWDISADGAAVPEAVTDLIHNIVQGALNNPSLGNISPEELWRFAQANRYQLLAQATHHQNETDVPQPDDTQIKLVRNDAGQFKLLNDIPPLPKGSIEQYASSTFGCPALRVIHPEGAEMRRTEDDRLKRGSANYIDHLLAVAINEAYERNIFDITQYRQAAAA